MTTTLLLDLDHTLLDTRLESFLPVYFQALAKHLEPVVPASKVVPALVAAADAMEANEDPRRTLLSVFEEVFYPHVGIPTEDLAELLTDFFECAFPALERHARQKPEAVRFVQWAVASGYHVAVAADPVLPQAVVEERIRWAGFSPHRFSLLSSAEDFHFTKSHPAYYAELLGRLGWQDGPVIVVGSDMHRDIVPARQLGLNTFLLEDESVSHSGAEAGRGTWEDLQALLESTDLSLFEPDFKTPDGIVGILASTPAVMLRLCDSLTDDQWRHEPAWDDWVMTEIVCHLRDTEREVHAMQLQLMIEKPDAFIPRPDTAVWASERDYLSEDGEISLQSFVNARVELLTVLKSLPGGIWNRRTRHAIFGPTDFLEIMSFVADHDRLHLQQAWKTLQTLQVGASI